MALCDTTARTPRKTPTTQNDQKQAKVGKASQGREDEDEECCDDDDVPGAPGGTDFQIGKAESVQRSSLSTLLLMVPMIMRDDKQVTYLGVMIGCMI